MPKPFPHLHQPDAMDCGATCLAMIAKHYGKTYTIQRLREMCSASRAGVSLLGISDAAEKLGFKTMGVRINFRQLCQDVPLPCIVHWKQEHFVVVYDIKHHKTPKTSSSSSASSVSSFPKCTIKVADPAHGFAYRKTFPSTGGVSAFG